MTRAAASGRSASSGSGLSGTTISRRGFNISRYEHHGVISDYWIQDQLQDTMRALLWQFKTGEAAGHFGRPSP